MMQYKKMRVLVACEESQIVCKAFRERGHEAFSCDIQPCSGGHPEWHIQDDVLNHLSDGWDLMVAHPPCTFLSNVGQACKTRYNQKEYRESEELKAIRFVLQLWHCPIKKVCIENPVGRLNTQWRKPSQIIQPYYFGDGEMKTTCLWLRGLSRLNGHHHIDKIRDKPKPLKTRIGSDGKLKSHYFCSRMDNKSNAAKLKSKTFPGIAAAMAQQWG